MSTVWAISQPKTKRKPRPSKGTEVQSLCVISALCSLATHLPAPAPWKRKGRRAGVGLPSPHDSRLGLTKKKKKTQKHLCACLINTQFDLGVANHIDRKGIASHLFLGVLPPHVPSVEQTLDRLNTLAGLLVTNVFWSNVSMEKFGSMQFLQCFKGTLLQALLANTQFQCASEVHAH